MATEEFLEIYYKGLAQKSNWETGLSDDFKFIRGEMPKPTPVIGKAAYIGVINRFSDLFTTMRVKKMVVDYDTACLTGNYDFIFSDGAI